MTLEKIIKYIDSNLKKLSKHIKTFYPAGQTKEKTLDNIWCAQDTVYECENKDDLFNWLQTMNQTLKHYILYGNDFIVHFYNELVFDILDYITNDR